MTFDLAVVTLTLYRQYLRNSKMLEGIVDGGADVHHHAVTFTLALPKFVDLPYLRHISPITKIYGLLQLCFYLIVKFPLTAILQLINFIDLYFLVY